MKLVRFIFAVFMSLVWISLLPMLHAGEEGGKGEWVAIEKSVEIQLATKDGSVTNKTVGISHVCVDRTTGDLFGFIPGSGLWKSTDQGTSFTQIYTTNGRCWSTYSLLIDPLDGKRIFCLMANAPSVLTLDGGKNWIAVNQGSYVALLNWNDPEVKTMAVHANGHEPWKISHDQGKTWRVPKSENFKWGAMLGFFDEMTYVCCGGNKQLLRSEDGDGIFSEVGKAQPAGATVRNFVILKDHGYLLAKDALVASLDKGRTWTMLPVPAGMSAGPYFGKEENHIVIVSATQGFFESKDAGKTWSKVMAMPFAVHDLGGGMNHGDSDTCGYDPVHDIFYLCAKGHPVQKYQR